MSFKRLDYVLVNELPIEEPSTKTKTAKAQPEAKLIIDAPVEEMPQRPPVQTKRTVDTPRPPASTGKLGALSKIRSQYAGNSPNTVANEIIPLTETVLQEAWQQFVTTLREARNPAVPSFELAELRIKDEASFEIVTPNNLQLKFVESERNALSEHLQNWFYNRQLTFFIVVEENLDVSQKTERPLNTKEQYQQIINNYPLVKELRDKLNLDLDY